MKRVIDLPLQARKADAQEEALELLHQDCEHLAHRLALDDEAMAEVLADLYSWYDPRPVRGGRRGQDGKGVRR